MDAFLLLPLIGAAASLGTGIAAYISGKLREKQRREAEAKVMAAQAEAKQKLITEVKKLDLNNLRLTDAEHPDKFIDVTPEQLGQIAEQYGHDS
jgi:hypothetical protein